MKADYYDWGRSEFNRLARHKRRRRIDVWEIPLRPVSDLTGLLIDVPGIIPGISYFRTPSTPAFAGLTAFDGIIATEIPEY